MSLVSLVRSESKVKDVLKEISPTKKSFSSNLGIPGFSKDTPIIIPYQLENRKDASIVGTAADYMFRFITARIIDHNKKDALKDLTAESGALFIGSELSNDFKMKIWKTFDESVVVARGYIHGEDYSLKQLASISIRLAYLEQNLRSGMLPEQIEDILDRNDPIMINDLIALSRLYIERFVESGIIRSDSDVVFNPHFGKWSFMCGGADADIYIDGTLYDFKCRKDIYKDWTEIGQLYGYYCLYLLCKMDGEEKEEPWINKPLTSIAIYHARHGMIDTCVINDSDADYSIEALQRLRVAIDEERNKHDKKPVDSMKSTLKDSNKLTGPKTRLVKRNVSEKTFSIPEGARVYGGKLLGFGIVDKVYHYKDGAHVTIKLDEGKITQCRLIDFYDYFTAVVLEEQEIEIGKRLLIPSKGEGKIIKIEEHNSFKEVVLQLDNIRNKREITIDLDSEEWYIVRRPYPQITDPKDFPYKQGEKAKLASDYEVTITGFEEINGKKVVLLTDSDKKIIKGNMGVVSTYLMEEKPL